MDELFRLKIASKRQVTLPPRLLELLELREGDEIRLEVIDGQISKAEACRVVPTRLFTPEILRQIALREAEEPRGKSLDPRQLVNAAEMVDDPAASVDSLRMINVGNEVQLYRGSTLVGETSSVADEGHAVNTDASKKHLENAG